MCTQPAQEPCCCARLYSATATDCMAFRAPPQSMGPCSSCTATVWRRHGSYICSSCIHPTPRPQGFVQACATGGPSQPDVLQVALLEGCAGSVRLTGQRQLGCYHQWTMDAAVAQRGAEAAAYAAVGLSDNSVRVYTLQHGEAQVRISFGLYLACQLLVFKRRSSSKTRSSILFLGSADCPNHDACVALHRSCMLLLPR